MENHGSTYGSSQLASSVLPDVLNTGAGGASRAPYKTDGKEVFFVGSMTFTEEKPKGPVPTWPNQTSPLVLDLDGDGVELITLDNPSAFFGMDNDGVRQKVGWVKADDAQNLAQLSIAA